MNEKAIVRKLYWGLLPWLFVSGLVVYIDRSNLAYAAPAFKRDLHLSNFEYGVGSGRGRPAPWHGPSCLLHEEREPAQGSAR